MRKSWFFNTQLKVVLFALLVVVGGGACGWLLFDNLTRNRRKWVHPEITGIVIDKASGSPVSGAIIELTNSTFGNRQSVSSESGEFRLEAVSTRYLFVLPLHGDECFITEIKCSASHYHSKTIELSHGPNGVWDESPELIPVVFNLERDSLRNKSLRR